MALDALGGPQEVWRGGLCGFGLEDGEAVGPLDDEVGFDAVPVAVVEETAGHTVVHSLLQDLRDDPGLEDRSPEGMGAELVRSADAQQPADQAAVVEVELRELDEPLAEVRVERLESEGDEARFQNAEPGLGGGL